MRAGSEGSVRGPAECACGKITLAKLPDGVSPSAFGPRLHAVTATLRADARLRALRHPVIARKLSFGSQSERGFRFIERMISVRATLRQQGRSLLDFLVARLSGHHVGLLPV